VSNNQRTFDLIMRAQDFATKTIQDVAKAVTNLETQVESQTKAAETGAGGTDELRRSLTNLRDVARAIAKDQALVTTFKRQQEALEAATRAVEDQKAKLAKIKAEQDAAG
jgi:peptidoglycan hydrolase CwlO-like protein